MGKLPGVDKGSEFANWLSNALSQVKLDEVIDNILRVLITCGSVSALQKTMPEFKMSSLTTCTPAVWKQCRKQLEVKVIEKGIVSAKFDWLPMVEDSATAEISTSGKKEEL